MISSISSNTHDSMIPSTSRRNQRRDDTFFFSDRIDILSSIADKLSDCRVNFRLSDYVQVQINNAITTSHFARESQRIRTCCSQRIITPYIILTFVDINIFECRQDFVTDFQVKSDISFTTISILSWNSYNSASCISLAIDVPSKCITITDDFRYCCSRSFTTNEEM